MNKRLELLRERLGTKAIIRPTVKEQVNRFFKERLTTVFAIAAFCFSTISFYRTIEHKDDLKIIFNTEPFLTIDREKRQYRLLMNTDMTFINGGSRHAGIYGLKVSLEQSNDTGQFQGSCHGYQVSFSIDPFVVKPGELVVRKIDQLPDGWKKDAEGQWIPIPIADGAREYNARVCILISFVTPEKAFFDHDIPLFIRRFAPKEADVDDGPTERILKSDSTVTLWSNRNWGL